MQEGLVKVEGSSYQLQPTVGRCWSTQQGVIRSSQEDKRSCFHHCNQAHSLCVTRNNSGLQPLVYWPISGWIQIRWCNYINKWTLGEDVCPKMRYSNTFLCIKLPYMTYSGKEQNVSLLYQCYWFASALSDLHLPWIHLLEICFLHWAWGKCVSSQ